MADTIESTETETTTDKEPVKNEESTTSTSNNDERNDDANSPPPNCSICLGKLVNTSFTDSCLHQFCFTCLLQWSRIKTECPLCKQTFKSIIHNVRSEEDYDQYHVPRELTAQSLPPSMPNLMELNMSDAIDMLNDRIPREMRRFTYRTTMVPNRILEMRSSAAPPPRREPGQNVSPTLSREELFRRMLPITHRRTIFHPPERPNYVPGTYSRFRESSAEYYQRHPQELERLTPWINRELATLLHANEPHVAYVSRIVMDALIRYDIRSPEFTDAIHLYLTLHTRLFIHKLLNFCRNELSASDHDASINYGYSHSVQGLSGGFWTRVQSPISSSSTNSSSTDDSDVRVVDHVGATNNGISRMYNDFLSLPSAYSELNMPGPSTVSETFHVNGNNTNANNNDEILTGSGATSLPCVLIISSSSSSDSDECEVVGYVKPRHERTPEIIELISSDDEGIVSNDDNDDLELTPKNISIIAINDDISCTSNASNNNERTNMSNNQTPKTNAKLYDLVTGTLSSSESTLDNGSDSDSDFVLRPSQKRRKSRRNTKRGKGNGGKKIERKNSKKSPRKQRDKNSTNNSIDRKKDNKRRRNSNNGRGDNNKSEKNVCKIYSGSSDDENDVDNGEWHMSKNTSTNERKRNSRSSSTSSDNSSSSRSTSSTSSTSTNSTSTTNTSIYGSTTSLNSINTTNNHSKNDKIRKKKNSSRNNKVKKSKNNSKQSDNKNDNSKSKKPTKSKLKSTVVKLQRPVNSTLLRKDTDKKEWYIEYNRQSRSRSRSRSSYESQHDSSSRRHRRRHRHRSTSNNSGKDNTHEKKSESKTRSERLENQSLYSNTNSQNEDVNDDNNDDGAKVHNCEHSNSQSSTIMDKYSNSNEKDDHNTKYNNKRKNIKEDKATNGEQSLNVPSTSTSLIQKYFNAKNSSSGDKKRNSNTSNNSKIKKKKMKTQNEDVCHCHQSQNTNKLNDVDDFHRHHHLPRHFCQHRHHTRHHHHHLQIDKFIHNICVVKIVKDKTI